MATHLGSFDEYVQDGINGAFIDDFNYESIFNAYQKIEENIEILEKNCRDIFLNTFCYRNQEENFKKIVEQIMK